MSIRLCLQHAVRLIVDTHLPLTPCLHLQVWMSMLHVVGRFGAHRSVPTSICIECGRDWVKPSPSALETTMPSLEHTEALCR